MQLTPEIKAQLAEQKKQCIFCKLISGEMPAKKIFEDSVVVGMVDIHPAKKGHTLFMLKEHYPIMPYIPPEEFKHIFGLIPQLCKSVQKAMVTTSVNVFIANGGPAGQQAPHFLMHIFPRDQGDGFFNFFWKEKESLDEEATKILTHNFPIMMQNHFGRVPASWHKGTGERPSHLSKVEDRGTVIYEDEKALCLLLNKGMVKGHIEIYSKEEKSEIGKLSIESSAHLFYVASFAATLVFEGLKVQGTNIILKSGIADDNLDGNLCVHVLPRMQDDGLNKSLLWEPKQPSYDLDSIMKKIKDKTWNIKYTEEKEVKTEVKKETFVQPEVIKLNTNSEQKEESSHEEEIKKAIERIRD
jgi:histidine triad (HIT) family protein